MKKIYFKISLLIFASLLFVFPFFTKAESYDAYVDAGYSGEEDGSKSKPFSKIMEAIDDGAKKIFIDKGKYEEKVTMKKSVKLYGKDRGDVIISNSVTMGDNTSLKDITVNGDIVVEKGSNVNIEKCIVKINGFIGINIVPGDGKLTILDSKIHDGKGKSIYVQAGNKVDIRNNEIYGNSEEGIDVRAKVSGTISGNSIHDNGESGIEIIVGSSDVLISKNTIKKNHASGIAAQFYRENKKTGSIALKNNTLSNNGKFGIDCAVPSGGNPAADYWSNSIELIENTIEKNKNKSISKFCNIIDAVDEAEEKKDNKIVEDSQAEVSENEAVEAEEEKFILEEIGTIKNYQDEVSAGMDEKISQIKSRGKIKTFLWGPDYVNLGMVQSELEKIRENREKLLMLSEQSKVEENKMVISELLSQLEKNLGEKEALVSEYENKFSLFGWLIKLTRWDEFVKNKKIGII